MVSVLQLPRAGVTVLREGGGDQLEQEGHPVSRLKEALITLQMLPSLFHHIPNVTLPLPSPSKCHPLAPPPDTAELHILAVMALHIGLVFSKRSYCLAGHNTLNSNKRGIFWRAIRFFSDDSAGDVLKAVFSFINYLFC